MLWREGRLYKEWFIMCVGAHVCLGTDVTTSGRVFREQYLMRWHLSKDLKEWGSWLYRSVEEESSQQKEEQCSSEVGACAHVQGITTRPLRLERSVQGADWSEAGSERKWELQGPCKKKLYVILSEMKRHWRVLSITFFIKSKFTWNKNAQILCAQYD